MKPTAHVIRQTLNGRTFIPVGKQGKAWEAYRRPEHLCFAGQRVFELALYRPCEDWRPFNAEWLVDCSDGCPPMLIRASNA